MGTNVNFNFAPYYSPSASSQSIELHVWARPKTDQYLRALQIKVSLPTGLTSEGASFTSSLDTGYDHSQSFNVEGERIMGLTSVHSSTVPVQNRVYLGYFTVNVLNDANGLLDGVMSVLVVSLESNTHAALGDPDNVKSRK